MSSFSLSSWRIVLRYSIYTGLSNTWKLLCSYFCSPRFLTNTLSFEQLLPNGSCIVSLWLFLRFFYLSLVYQSLLMICLGVDFYGFSHLRFVHFLESVGLSLWMNLKTSVIISLNSCSASHSFLLPGILMIKMLDLLLLSQRSLRSCNFFQSIFSLLFRLSKFYGPVLKFMILF